MVIAGLIAAHGDLLMTKGGTMSRSILAVEAILAILAAGQSGCQSYKQGALMKGDVMYNELTTNMMVEDVNRTLDFYCEVLGFEFVIGVPKNSQEIVTDRPQNKTLGFAIMKSGNVQMMFQERDGLVEEMPDFAGITIGGSLTFYIEVRDAKELYEKVKNKATIVKELQTKFYGKEEFYIRDCNGYMLCFASNI
jgi:uncharacterized glyoxalase superfamily protein PhnB